MDCVDTLYNLITNQERCIDTSLSKIRQKIVELWPVLPQLLQKWVQIRPLKIKTEVAFGTMQSYIIQWAWI